jgi:ParB/RepB/Spo0J family partition protein
MTVKRIPLQEIEDNPWQVRAHEDLEHIAQLAASIGKDGLLQIPVGRRHNGKVQLAFGMSRLAAYKLMKQKQMPVDIKKLNDRRMFELAIIENEDRKDLSPIEQARAMRRAMDEFGMDRTAVGKLFGIQPGSVSNKMNLLDLPDDVQQLVQEGAMPERTARTFVHIARLKPEVASQVAIQAVDETDPERVERLVIDGMRQSAKEIGGPWDRGRVEGKWFKFEAKFRGPLPLKPTQVRNAIRDLADEDGKIAVFENVPSAQTEQVSVAAVVSSILVLYEQGQDPATIVELYGYPETVIDRIEQLRNPPACTTCSFHSVIGDRHFCALKPCLITKKDAMKAREFAKVQRKKDLKGIAAYDKKADGEYKAYPGGSTYYGYGSDGAVAKEIFDKALAGKRDRAHLRLRQQAPSTYYREDGITDSAFAELVAVGPLLAKLEKGMETKQGREGEDWEAKRRQREINALLNDRVTAVILTTAGCIPCILSSLSIR